jgi:hypothetical protein
MQSWTKQKQLHPDIYGIARPILPGLPLGRLKKEQSKNKSRYAWFIG